LTSQVGDNIDNWIKYKLLEFGSYQLTVGQILLVCAVIIIAFLFIKLLRLYFRKFKFSDKIDPGRLQSYIQLTKYVVVVIAIAICLRIIGIDVTIFIAGSAALLVGFGLGIQKIFNDLVSGIVILVEGTLEVGDIIETEGVVGEVLEIGLRTSELLTRDDIVIIVPNSTFVIEKVINWTHNNKATRFSFGIGVPYGSDSATVKDLITGVLRQHPDVNQDPPPFARLCEFGDSALNFEALFYSKNMFRIENTKSDLRISIYEKLAENGINIPFPQRDIHIIKAPEKE
jgi:small-conductance mechanosensitive channel